MNMEIRYIDKKHSNDINIPNEPFPIKGRMKVSYHGDKWNHEEELLVLYKILGFCRVWQKNNLLAI